MLGFDNRNSHCIPYPRVEVCQPNLYYAGLLQKDYSGISSEYTAISQYMYAHLIAEDKGIANHFLEAARDEMTHLHLLGHAIVMLGGNPVFVTEQGVFWDSSLVHYGLSTPNRLELAVMGELDAIRTYEEHAALIEDACIKRLLNRIIMDERDHYEMFKKDLTCFMK